MKKRFTDEQIIGFLTQAAAGTPIKELCQRTNQSSCWTHIAASEKAFFAPLPKSQK